MQGNVCFRVLLSATFFLCFLLLGVWGFAPTSVTIFRFFLFRETKNVGLLRNKPMLAVLINVKIYIHGVRKVRLYSFFVRTSAIILSVYLFRIVRIGNAY